MNFKLQALDHVAIRALDTEKSARWYQEVLGLDRYDIPEWQPYPIFLFDSARQFGVAIFPAGEGPAPSQLQHRVVKIDHFAFRVSIEDFQLALAHYQDLGLEFQLRDHTYFHSVYVEDPDGHTVELTTLVVAEDSLEPFKTTT